MANKKISEFTEKSSISNSDIFLLSDGSNTYKTQMSTVRTSLNADTGWVALSKLNGVTGGLSYRVINGVLYIYGQDISAGSATQTIMATLPVGYRPSVRWTVKPSYPDYENNTYINIQNGNITLINLTGVSISQMYFTTAVPI